MKTITIKLTAPLQSYGNEATFDRRTTRTYPSKSAMIGMIAAALGYARDDSHILELNRLSFAVRVDQPGKILTDYQVVEWKKDKRKITYRDYLQDAVFVVALGSDDSQLISKIEAALHQPHFSLFLGRRSNAPAGVIQVKIFKDSTPLSALKELNWQASTWYQKRHADQKTIHVELIADADLLPDQPSTMVKDRVISFDQRHRQYGFSPIVTTRLDLVNPCFKETNHSTTHDVMRFV